MASEGLKTTLELLATSENEAAVQVLLPGLDSPIERIRDDALGAILARRSAAGQREVVRRLHELDERRKAIIRERGVSMTQALRESVLSTDRQTCRNACDAALWFHEYDLIPTLLGALGDHDNPDATALGATLIELTEGLYAELAGEGDNRSGRDPELTREHAISALESSIERFHGHLRREVIEAFLILVHPDNAVLRQILDDPFHTAFATTVNVLAKSDHVGVLRLLLACLDDPNAPNVVFSVIGNRSDATFVRSLLRKIGREPSEAMARNLKRVGTIGWLDHCEAMLDGLDDAQQHAAVRFVMAAGVPRFHAQEVIEHVLIHGKPGGRRAASEALAEFHGAQANARALAALGDNDPQVQANVIAQLRRRGIPGALARLVELADSPHAVVRQAVRQSLEEFTFERYVGVFDTLDEQSQRTTGMLAKKIDPHAMAFLRQELGSKMRMRRLRALRIVRAIDAIDAIEPLVIAALEDEDHLVRLEAVNALAGSDSRATTEALRQALGDRSQTVADAARRFLDHREESARPGRQHAETGG